jgi:hypothetical protein
VKAHQLEHSINKKWITNDQPCSVADILVPISGSSPAGLPLATAMLALDRSTLLRTRSSGGSCSGAGNSGGNEEDRGELHSCW